MFAKTIIDSDAFLDMPLSTQALYFHLSMRADDEGFINNPKKIQRMIGASDDDAKVLVAKHFIIPFESGVVVIKHWKIHNYIQSDRFKPTVYTEERKALSVKNNKAYTLSEPDVSNLYPTCIQTGDTGKDRIGKDRLGQDRTGKDRIDYNAIADAYNRICTSMSKCTKLSDGRKKHIKARLKSFTVEQIELAFSKADASDFLTGKKGNWKANFDWIIKSDDNLLKILEGKYDNCGSSCPSSGWSFTDL